MRKQQLPRRETTAALLRHARTIAKKRHLQTQLAAIGQGQPAGDIPPLGAKVGVTTVITRELQHLPRHNLGVDRGNRFVTGRCRCALGLTKTRQQQAKHGCEATQPCCDEPVQKARNSADDHYADGHSAFTFASRATRVQRAMSAATRLVNSSGDMPEGSTPRPAMRSRTSGNASTRTSS